MMKKLLLSLCGILVCASVFAQSQLNGNVLDATNNIPLTGATVKKNKSQTTTTDDNGAFSLPCNNGGMTLTITYIGYKPYTANVSTCSETLQILMVPSTSSLDEVQLSANSYRQESLEKPVSEVKLNPRELNRGTGLFLDDAINTNVPGVTMTRRAVSSGQQFNIRGYGNGVGFKGISNNFDGQGYKAYLNNIPITDAEGVTILDDIDFVSIGSVDVIKGPAASKYGFAIAGAVNLKTIRPKNGETSISQKVTVGNYGLARFTTQFQMGREKTSLLLNYGHQVSDGFMDHNNSTKDFMNLVFDFRPNEKQYISTYFGFSNSYDERGGELTIEQYENEDYSGNPRYIKNNAHSEIISFRAGLSHTYAFNNWLSNTTTVFGTGKSTNNSSAGGWNDSAPLNYGTRSVFNLNFDLGDDFSLSGEAGLEFQEQRSQNIGYSMVENPSDPVGYNIIGGTKSNKFATSKSHLLFTEWVLNMPYDFSLTAGVGKSSLFIDIEDHMYNPDSNSPRVVSANYDDLVSPHFAINKVFNDNISVYASYRNGYKAPVSGNIILSTTGGLNTGLVPEEGNQFEIGSKGNVLDNKLYYQVALFQATFKDKFTSVAVPAGDGTTLYSYLTNGGKVDNKGIETLIKYNAYESSTGFFRSVHPYVNVTYSDFKYENFQYETVSRDGELIQQDYSGNDVAGVAPWVVNAGVDVNTNLGFYGNVTYMYRDAVPYTSDGLNVADSYSLLNGKIGYRTSIGQFDLDAFFGANNITGEQYYYMLFLNQLDDAYIPAPLDINYFGGINLKYNL